MRASDRHPEAGSAPRTARTLPQACAYLPSSWSLLLTPIPELELQCISTVVDLKGMVLVGHPGCKG